jgi:peptidoglycan-associated lipoprotein
VIRRFFRLTEAAGAIFKRQQDGENTMFFRTLLISAMVLALAACEHKKPAMQEVPPDQQGSMATSETGGVNAGGVVAAGTQQDFIVNVGDRVFFGYDEYNLTPEAQHTLQLQSEWLKKYPNFRLQVEGHCDERGTREYNLALGDRRATAVKNYLVSLGIPSDRVSTISYGKERPAVLGSNPSAWAQNRRGVTVLQ